MGNKYNTGMPIDINAIPPEEIKKAFHEWAEGSEALEILLNEGYKKGFLSYACCSGDSGLPYINYELNDDYSRKMAISIATELINSKLDCQISFLHDFYNTEEEYRKMRKSLIESFPNDFSEKSLSPKRTITEFHVFTLLDNREEVFRMMARHIKEIKLDQLDSVKLPTSREEVPNSYFINQSTTKKFATVEIGRATTDISLEIKEKVARVEADVGIKRDDDFIQNK